MCPFMMGYEFTILYLFLFNYELFLYINFVIFVNKFHSLLDHIIFFTMDGTCKIIYFRVNSKLSLFFNFYKCIDFLPFNLSH